MGVVGQNVVLNFGLSYVWGAGEAFGNRLDNEGNLQPIITKTKEDSLYAFASTTYRF